MFHFKLAVQVVRAAAVQLSLSAILGAESVSSGISTFSPNFDADYQQHVTLKSKIAYMSLSVVSNLKKKNVYTIIVFCIRLLTGNCSLSSLRRIE